MHRILIQLICLIIPILLTTPTSAQVPWSVTDKEDYFVYYLPITYKPAKRVSRIIFTQKSQLWVNTHRPKRWAKHKSYKTYNNQMQLTGCGKIKRDGSSRPWLEFVYSPSGHYMEKNYYKKNGDIRLKVVFERDEDDNLLSEEKTRGNGSIIYRNTISYTADGRPATVAYYRGSRQMPRKKWVKTYYEDGQLKSTTLYNQKGKMDAKWNYDCKPEGEKVDVRKKEQLVCIKSEKGDSVLIRTSTTFTSKGQARRQVLIFNMDTLLLEDAIYNEQGKETDRHVYEYSDRKLVSDEIYFNGKFYLRRESVYEGHFVISEKLYIKRRVSSEIEYSYRDDLLILMLRKNGRGKVIESTFLAYD